MKTIRQDVEMFPSRVFAANSKLVWTFNWAEELACIDFRDVVGPAETPYPHFLIRPDGMTPEREAKANRDQYLNWLSRK